MPRERAAERKKRAGRIARKLARAYPEAHCALRHETPFQLLVATILSAQCTDEMVNRVTAELFREMGTPGGLASAAPSQVEALVRPTGFYRQKAKSIQAAARDVVGRFDGEVPGTMEDLVSLRGVARKTANVVLGNAFGVPGLAVDTHMSRVNRRLGLTAHDDPEKIERDLMELIPRSGWTDYTNRVIHHGRVCCQAKNPRCEACTLRDECPFPEAGMSRLRPAAGASAAGRQRSPRSRGR